MSFKGMDFLDLPDRSLSVDLFRGVVMFLLIGRFAGLFELLATPPAANGLFRFVGLQFRHAPWEGFRLADLGQPFFIFISGAAMVFSYKKRWGRGETWKSTFYHALTRASLLFLIGWALFHINSAEGASKGELFIQIFPQLAVAGLVAFLLLRQRVIFQLGVGIGVLIIAEALNRLRLAPGFDEPFTAGRNFGSFLDLTLFGELSPQNHVAFSLVPAVVFAILGIIAGGILGTGLSRSGKLRLLGAVGSFVTGLGLALSAVTPIISRLNTGSFVVLAGGLAFLSLALGFWLADMRGLRKRSLVFLVPGLNPLFIFLFALTGGAAWFRAIASPFTMSFEGWIGGWGAQLLTSLAVWGMLWALCYWLFKRKIFVRI